ncbi:MAG: hypothetical protein ACYTBJ_03980 [Planctomycetota bacterium]|jgi:hypothetical protein
MVEQQESGSLPGRMLFLAGRSVVVGGCQFGKKMMMADIIFLFFLFFMVAR